MIKSKTNAQNYESSVEIAEGIYWVGFHDVQSGLHCNPYLIVDHDEALVIDGGSRPDFATVMMKILQTGIAPKKIQALVYQHYDPDLCGSIPHFEDIIEIIAPQHGSVINDKETIRHVLGLLGSLENVGIDEIISEDCEPDFSSFDQRSDSR